ncbi:MAG TPA: DUF3455 domain-containing protein [Casimicrobiaceae bacterium]|nr:DUF3455 domain-containing protein [Casimicrobiaceae bacterium]
MQIRWTVLAAALLTAPALAQLHDVPAPVKPPAGQKAAMTWTGAGELTYECRAKADNPQAFEWVFVGPDAKLTDAQSKAAMGKYYAGPTWESTDGSKITGKQVAVAPAAAGNIPFQLVKTEGGSGAMKDVTYIQRINTQGGVAPSDACAAANKGAKKTVPYSADYVFYKAG